MISIALPGSIVSDLSWKEEKERAYLAIDKGEKVLWRIDLGLFSSLKYGLENQTQFLSLSLSLEEFERVIWNEFSESSVGLVLYEANVFGHRNILFNEGLIQNFSHWLKAFEIRQPPKYNLEDPFLDCLKEIKNDANLSLLFDLFLIRTQSEYLDLLRQRISDEIPTYIKLTSGPLHPVALAYLHTIPRHPSLMILTDSSSLIATSKIWNDSYGIVDVKTLPNEALSIPNIEFLVPEKNELILNSLELFISKNKPFRLMAQQELSKEWEGLDCLHVDLKTLSVTDKRMLQGFEAAGGIVHPI